MFQALKDFDTRLFLYLNSKHNHFFDVIMYWASDKLFWIPLYIFIAWLLVKYYKKKSIIIFISIAILITITDQVSSNAIRDGVHRLRPSHEPAIQHLVHLSSAGPGGMYGFVSSHAANAFALTAFLFIVLPARFKRLKYFLIGWAALIGYSRIYNGVHYPGDVVCGAIFGIITASIISCITLNFMNRSRRPTN